MSVVAAVNPCSKKNRGCRFKHKSGFRIYLFHLFCFFHRSFLPAANYSRVCQLSQEIPLFEKFELISLILSSRIGLMFKAINYTLNKKIEPIGLV